jgi:cytoskeletal protein CcmA (bactofilin family)
LQSKAKISGDMRYETLEIHLGAIVDGKLMHNKTAATDKVVAFKLNSGE